MAIINPEGLFGGGRLRRCSNLAKLHWPYMYLASNGFGRLEINYPRIMGRAYPTFDPIPTESEIMGFIREYVDNRLLFLYESEGQLWGQWDTPLEFLPRYKTAQDRRSPSPPEPAFTEWKRSYREESKSFPKCFEDLPKVSATFLCGVGVGGGVGGGVGDGKTPCSSADERSAGNIIELTPPESGKPVDEVARWFTDEFWPLYPRKVAKPQALKAAKRHAKTLAARVAIMECLKQRLPSLQSQFRTDGDFRPYPSSWLNQTPWTEPEDSSVPVARDAAGGALHEAIDRMYSQLETENK